MHRHELAVLSALKEAKRLSFEALLNAASLEKNEALWAISNLSAMGFITVEKAGEYEIKISGEGEEYAKRKLPELSLLKKVGTKGIELAALTSKEDQIGLNWAKRKELVQISDKMLRLTEKGKKVSQTGIDTDSILKEIFKNKSAYDKYRGSEAARELEQRGLLEVKERESIKQVEITQQGVLALAKERQSESEIEALDRSMINSRSWAGKKFRPYNVDAPVEPADVAMRHPLRRTINEIREAYVGLGFREVSGPIIEPAFWVFDYLFVPQDHPARDVQDTFFLARPSELAVKDKKLVERIKKEHEGAWHSEWSEKEATQAVARTHTTSVTGRYIHEIIGRINSGEKFELPVKLFTVGRNLRNETIDPKHTADFYQHDGIIIGKNLTLANLFDTLIKLYGRLGIDELKLKPYYYPFVEPGVLILGKAGGDWLELGGAGVIRKEITGIARNSINVLAWGPGVERIMLIKKSVGNISELYGSSVGWLRERSMV